VILFVGFLKSGGFNPQTDSQEAMTASEQSVERARLTKFEALSLRAFGKGLSKASLKTALQGYVQALSPIDGSKAHPVLWRAVSDAVAAG
jgi:hypothetical protein